MALALGLWRWLQLPRSPRAGAALRAHAALGLLLVAGLAHAAPKDERRNRVGPHAGLQAAVDKDACATLCHGSNHTVSCGFRIRWYASHRFAGREAACQHAFEKARGVCSSCSDCSPEAAGCHSPAPKTTACDRICDDGKDAVSCKFRTQWYADHRYAGHKHACAEAMGKTWKLCPTCASCSLQASGCVALSSTSPTFDCETGFAKWKVFWTEAQQRFCCLHSGRGCPEETRSKWHDDTSPSLSTKHVFDCNMDFDRWMQLWSPAKKLYCCANKQRACPPVQNHRCTGDRSSWGEEKRIWCCSFTGIACQESEEFRGWFSRKFGEVTDMHAWIAPGASVLISVPTLAAAGFAALCTVAAVARRSPPWQSTASARQAEAIAGSGYGSLWSGPAGGEDEDEEEGVEADHHMFCAE